MIIAVDFGDRRCGYAIGEGYVSEVGVVETRKLMDFLVSSKPDEVVFGLPLSMSGRYSCQTFKVVERAHEVKMRLGVRVFLVDERLSTKMAHDILRRTRGNTPVDAVSASLILENFLSSPSSSYPIPDEIPRVRIEPIRAGSVLIHEVPDPGVLDYVESEELDVLQSDPYTAYLFKKRVRFVERFERFLKGGYDIIVTWRASEDLEDLLAENGKIYCARSSAG